MADDAAELFPAPLACDQTTEYDARIEDEVELEPDEDDNDPRKNLGEIEQQFARYERNYRARRIRELTLAPVKKKREARRTANVAGSAAA